MKQANIFLIIALIGLQEMLMQVDGILSFPSWDYYSSVFSFHGFCREVLSLKADFKN